MISIDQIVIFFTLLIAETYSAIFGGGGLISYPILTAYGLSPHLIIANDMAASCLTFIMGMHVLKSHEKMDWKIGIYWLPGLLIAPFFGSYALSMVSAGTLKYLVAVFCVIGAINMMVDFKRKKKTGRLPENWKAISLVLGFVLGFYDTFIGAGASTYFMMLLVGVFGLSMKKAMVLRNYLLVISMLVSTANYAAYGYMRWEIFLPMVIACGIAGYIGTHIAVRLPEKLLKKIFLLASILTSLMILV